MRVNLIWVTVWIAVLLIEITSADMPLGFYTALNNDRPKDILCVKNYDAGATVTEAYTDFDQLQKNTEVNTGSYASDSGSSGFLTASINSNVIGKAHIAWQSVDPVPDSKGRHRLLGRSVEDLTGVFSVEKFIQLWSNSSPGEVSVDWLPCT